MQERLQRRWWRGALLATSTACLAALPTLAMANTPQPPMEIGRLWHCPEYDGAEGWGSGVFNYPGGTVIPSDKSTPDPTNYIKRQWASACQKFGTYMWSTNWTDPDSTFWTDMGSYFFRNMNYDYPLTYIADDPNGNTNYLFPGGVQEIYRFQRPTILVMTDVGVASPPFFVTPDSAVVLPDNSGTGHRPPPIIDPSLVTEMSVHMWWRYEMGVQYNRDEYVYPQGTPHQDYVLQSINLVNNGIVGTSGTIHGGLDHNPDAPGPNDFLMSGQTIHNMVWAQNMDYRSQYVDHPTETGQDNEAAYVQPWGSGTGHYAMMFWDTDDPNTPGPDWGDPSTDAGWGGILPGNVYAGFGCLFASKGPGADYAVDDTSQPAFRAFWYERAFDYGDGSIGPPGPGTAADVEAQRNMLVAGGLQCPTNTQYTDFGPYAPVQAVTNGPGPTGSMGYGPVNAPISAANSDAQGWTIPFGDSVHIEQVLAGGAISKAAQRPIGQYYASQVAASADPSTYESAASIALIQTGADTLSKAFNMAYWNYYGHFPTDVTADTLAKWGIPNYAMTKPAAYNQPYNVPDAPQPPNYIYVSGNGTNGIKIIWGNAGESAVNHDTHVADFVGYRVYRSDGLENAPLTLIKEGPASDFTAFSGSNTSADSTNGAAMGQATGGSSAAAALGPGRMMVDTTVTPGTAYWYAVTTYDDGSQNWANTGHVLESSPWWTWTGFWLTGAQVNYVGVKEQARPDKFSLGQNAPNPFNPSTTINYSVPTGGHVNLVIYDLTGRVVRNLVDGNVTAGVHAVTWNGLDDAGRTAASGVYIYRLVAPNGQLTRRMTLVR